MNTSESRAGWLDELRTLAGAHPGETDVLKPFAMGLVNAATAAELDGDSVLADRLRGELQALTEAMKRSIHSAITLPRGCCPG